MMRGTPGGTGTGITTTAAGRWAERRLRLGTNDNAGITTTAGRWATEAERAPKATPPTARTVAEGQQQVRKRREAIDFFL